MESQLPSIIYGGDRKLFGSLDRSKLVHIQALGMCIEQLGS